MSRSMKLIPGLTRAGSWLTILLVLAFLLAGLYTAIAVLSFRFTPDVPGTERPVVATLALLAAAFAAYLTAIFVALRARDGKLLLAIVVPASVLFRVVSVYSWPILEIDIYRYIWDGAVTLEGVSPYRYSPQQVLSATPLVSAVLLALAVGAKLYPVVLAPLFATTWVRSVG